MAWAVRQQGERQVSALESAIRARGFPVTYAEWRKARPEVDPEEYRAHFRLKYLEFPEWAKGSLEMYTMISGDFIFDRDHYERSVMARHEQDRTRRSRGSPPACSIMSNAISKCATTALAYHHMLRSATACMADLWRDLPEDDRSIQNNSTSYFFNLLRCILSSVVIGDCAPVWR